MTGKGLKVKQYNKTITNMTLTEEQREQKRMYDKLYYIETIGQRKQYDKQYKAEHQEQIKQYREENREHARLYAKLYREDNKDTLKEKQKTIQRKQ